MFKRNYKHDHSVSSLLPYGKNYNHKSTYMYTSLHESPESVINIFEKFQLIFIKTNNYSMNVNLMSGKPVRLNSNPTHLLQI